MSNNHKYGVLIGRFEPFHNGHLSLVQYALSHVEELVIVLGSCNVARSIKNPWSAAERREMILSCLSPSDADRVTFIEASDYLYNDNRWITTIQQRVDEVTDGSDDVVLFGENKDRSSFYLQMFPQWKHLARGPNAILPIGATQVRETYFEGNVIHLGKMVPEPVYLRLRGAVGSDWYTELVHEFNFIERYRAEWSKAPYPPTFVTVDTVVICSGHVLLVRRKGYPGKGLMALPGGFLNQHERIQDAAIRELREETRIALTKDELHAAIVDQRVFDHPDRSTRGRTITHAFCLNLGTGRPPRVKGDDDAEHAFWLSFTDVAVRQSEFYEDHNHILTHFISKW
jgi:bifunctional NMN adenylyltransferase/nudix hydrolase